MIRCMVPYMAASTTMESKTMEGRRRRLLPHPMWRRPEAAPLVVAAESANATSTTLIGHDSGHGISDTYHRSG